MSSKYPSVIRFEVNVPITNLQQKLSYVLENKETGRGVHQILLDMVTPYVPMKSSALRESAVVYPKFVRWTTDYARYQYYGEVYGPNFVGWTSPATWEWRSASVKYPTGRELGIPGTALLKPRFGLQYNKSPIQVRFGYTTQGTAHHWGEKMMQEKSRGFTIRVTNLLKKRAKELTNK